jgi:hypothetical protein
MASQNQPFSSLFSEVVVGARAKKEKSLLPHGHGRGIQMYGDGFLHLARHRVECPASPSRHVYGSTCGLAWRARRICVSTQRAAEWLFPWLCSSADARRLSAAFASAETGADGRRAGTGLARAEEKKPALRLTAQVSRPPACARVALQQTLAQATNSRRRKESCAKLLYRSTWANEHCAIAQNSVERKLQSCLSTEEERFQGQMCAYIWSQAVNEIQSY